MRKFLGICLTLLATTLLAGYGLWTGQRASGHYLSDLRVQLVVDEGQPAGHGNLLGIETELHPTDYQDLERLHRTFAAYLHQARERGLLNDKTLVVLPEHVGTWLFATGEKSQFYQAATVDEAMQWLAWSNPLKFSMALLRASGEHRLDDAHLRMKAQAMAQDYQRLFGGLAKEFGVTLVAGSIVLPEPSVENGQLRVANGPLYNSSLTFGPDGRPLGQPQRQRYPSVYQASYIQPASRDAVQVLDTPAGRLAVLIGSDSWYPRNYRQAAEAGAELIAAPAFVIGKQRWQDAWAGHKGEDIDLQPGSLSEGQAWQRLSADGAQLANVRASISVFMRGQFWNQGSSGHSFASLPGRTLGGQPSEPLAAGGARLINVWL